MEIFPSSHYTVRGECLWGFSNSIELNTPMWGDVDSTGLVDVDDIICTVDAYSGSFTLCSFEASNIAPCMIDLVVDLDDILAVLDGFAQAPYPCPTPCP